MTLENIEIIEMLHLHCKNNKIPLVIIFKLQDAGFYWGFFVFCREETICLRYYLV